MANQPEANDFPLGNPRSPLRHQLDAHAHAVLHQHSLWVEDDRPSPLTGRRSKHFSRDNFFELAPYAGLLLNPESIFAASLTDPRLQRVLKAIAASYDAAGRLLGWETDQTLHAVLLGMLPILGEMAEVAGIGALVGGLVGAVAGFGLGDEVTIPGGAIAGVDIALTLFGLYGLAKMLREGGVHLEEFLRLATEASDLAFFAGENQMLHFSYEQDMRDATNLFAAAIGELWYVLLQAIVVYILKRAAELAGPAALESAGKLTARSEALQAAIKDAQGYTSKLGPGFSSWLDKNFEKIRKSVEDHQRSRQLGDDGGDGGDTAPVKKPNKPTQPRKLDYSNLEKSEFNGVKADRVRTGTNGKVAVIGRSMGSVVNPYAEGLKAEGYDVETFSGESISDSADDQWETLKNQYAPDRIPNDVIRKSLLFQENQAWAEKLADQGYTIVDVDNPAGQAPSPFYDIEMQTLFGGSAGDTN